MLLGGAGGSSSRGHAALCPVSCVLPVARTGRGGGSIAGTSQVVQGATGILCLPELGVKGRETQFTQSCLICLVSAWDLSCFTKDKGKIWGEKNRYFALTQETIMHIFAGKNRVYIIFWSSVFSQSLPCYFCFSKEMHFFQCVLNVLCTLQMCYTLRTPNALPVL